MFQLDLILRGRLIGESEDIVLEVLDLEVVAHEERVLHPHGRLHEQLPSLERVVVENQEQRAVLHYPTLCIPSSGTRCHLLLPSSPTHLAQCHPVSEEEAMVDQQLVLYRHVGHRHDPPPNVLHVVRFMAVKRLQVLPPLDVDEHVAILSQPSSAVFSDLLTAFLLLLL